MLLSRNRQSIRDSADALNRRTANPGEFHIEEAHVELSVMDDELCPPDKVEELVHDFSELRLSGQTLSRQVMDCHNLLRNLTLRIDERVVQKPVIQRKTPSIQLHTANFNQTVTVLRITSCRFRIQTNLSHFLFRLFSYSMSAARLSSTPGGIISQAPLVPRTTSTPQFASSSARSLPGSPAWPFTQRHSISN